MQLVELYLNMINFENGRLMNALERNFKHPFIRNRVIFHLRIKTNTYFEKILFYNDLVACLFYPL